MGIPCQDLHVQFCRFRQKVRLQYCIDKFSSDTSNHPLRICQSGCSFFSCPKMELKQCYLMQTQCIWKNTGPSACSHSKCHNAFQNLTILPPHTHSSFPCFSSLEVTPTSSILLSHAFSKPSHHAQPHVMSVAERGPFIISPRHLKHLPPKLKELFKAPLQPKKGFFSRGEICCCY